MLPMNPSRLYFIADLEPECSDQSSPLTPPTLSSPGAKVTEPPPHTPQFLFLSNPTGCLMSPVSLHFFLVSFIQISFSTLSSAVISWTRKREGQAPPPLSEG